MGGAGFGWLEIVLGAVGLVLGVIGKSNRSSVVISIGLLVMGVSHLVAKNYQGTISDVGGLILLFGLGMMIAFARQNRAKKGKNGGR